MTHENDDDDREAAHRMAAAISRTIAQAQAEYGLSSGAASSGCLTAAVRTARQDMEAEAVADWLRDVADAVEAERAPPDCAGSA